MKIKLSQSTKSLGRNGEMVTTGLEIHRHLWNDGQTLSISPVTSRDLTGRCSIEIPVADIPQLVKALTELIAKPMFYNQDLQELADTDQLKEVLLKHINTGIHQDSKGDVVFYHIYIQGKGLHNYVVEATRDKDFKTLSDLVRR